MLRRRAEALLVLAAALAAISCASGTPSPEHRAVSFLAQEVRDWPLKNKCFSCHNNGDAARALYAARRLSIPFDARCLEATNGWLTRPGEWKDNGPPGDFSDKNLAALQFAHALSAAVDAGVIGPDATFVRAAGMLRDQQEADGSWKVDADGLAGSPVTYGRTLATVVARQVLARAGKERSAETIDRADAWLRTQRPVGVLDAAAILIGLARLDGTPQHLHCLDVIRKGQTRDGGWGPYVTSPPEVFDTAIALLGLSRLREEGGVPEMIRRGRDFLVDTQRADGSWPETTRPPGAKSYAQRISTTAWATLALLDTR